jgi:WD40 repeat protein
MQGGLSLHVEQAEPAWRYAVETEFADLSPDPKPIETTTLIYDSNNRQLPFERSPTQSSIHRAFSEDERWFALAVGEDIDLYGHTVEINYVAFAPGRSDTLISSARCWEQVRSWRETRKLERPEIFVWDIKGIMTRNTTQSGTNVAPESMDDLIGRVRTVQPKEDPPTASELSEQDRLAQTLDTLFSRLANRYSARQIRGRLCSSLQSSLFNHAGTILVFLPGTSPLSNGDHRWDFALHNLETLQVVTLTGHRDWIGWTCFTPDDKLVISASSDRTFRVWDPETGECVRTWNVDSGACSGLVV